MLQFVGAEELPVIGPRLEAAIAKREPRFVEDEHGGRVFRDQAAGLSGPSAAWKRQILETMGAQMVMNASGQYVEEAWLPDPVRLYACTRAKDLPLYLESAADPNTGDIPGKQYGRIVQRLRLHPVGIHNLLGYFHDTFNPADHIGGALLGGRGLIALYGDCSRDLITVAATHDLITAKLGSALSKLFRKQTGFDHFMEEELPHLVDVRTHDTTISAATRLLLSEGMDRLGIDHPDISQSQLQRDCMNCYQQAWLRDQAV